MRSLLKSVLLVLFLCPSVAWSAESPALQPANTANPRGSDLSTSSASGMVTLNRRDQTVEVLVDGKPFTTCHFKGYRKPFFAPLITASGVSITRPLEAPAIKDHPHHKGLWLSLDEVNEHKHWTEAQEIRSEKIEILTAKGNPAELLLENVWLDKEGEPLLRESTKVSIFADRLISYAVTLSPAGNESLTFGDTKEGFFAVRLRDELREKGGSGKIINSLGATGEASTWGQPAPWVDYSGTVQQSGKELAAGIALFDDKSNFRPSRYHVRAYGLFGVSPFGQHDYSNKQLPAAPVTLEKGHSLSLHYGAFIHDGPGRPEVIEQRYQEFLSNEAAR